MKIIVQEDQVPNPQKDYIACQICKTKITSPENYLNHVSSAEHRKCKIKYNWLYKKIDEELGEISYLSSIKQNSNFQMG